MTTKTEQHEPTMEEILASIRRIISEENEGEEGTVASEDVTAPASNGADHADNKTDEAAVAEAGDTDTDTEEPKDIEEPEEPGTDDVLELTEVVEDDEMPADEDTDLDIEMESNPSEARADESGAEDVPVSDSDSDIDRDIDIESEVDLQSDAAPVSEPDPAGIAEAVSERIEEQHSDWDDPVDPADEQEALTSEQPSDQARNAFQDLSDLLVAGYQGSDNTLESMVRQMLKPMLKSWLDENLPGMVERMVSREIARLSRSKKP